MIFWDFILRWYHDNFGIKIHYFLFQNYEWNPWNLWFSNQFMIYIFNKRFFLLRQLLLTKSYFFTFRQVFITYIDTTITYDTIMSEMREICGFPRVHPFTIKWVDEEGDPCTISSQRELSEAIRLYEANKEAELTVHGKT